MKTVWALGIGASGSGYPNAAGVIALLSRQKGWHVVDRVRWMPDDVQLWRLAKGSGKERVRILSVLLCRLVFLPFDLVRARLADATVFAPYPALFLLAGARCLPHRLRPRIVADCFISIWDSGFSDRKVTANGGWIASAVKRFESWCLGAADAIVVDTFENRALFERDLALDAQKIHVLPLAVDVSKLMSLEPATIALSRPLRVLYVGTFVPLHGFPVIIDALKRLSEGDNVEIRVVGDGQDSGCLQDAMRVGFACKVEWIREWQSLDGLVGHYAWADVCLGVFGSDGKASRVLPFKVYAALAAGRVVVTQQEMGSPVAGRPPAITCQSNGASLAETLRQLASDPSEVMTHGLSGRRFFQTHLSEAAISDAWSRMWDAL